MSEIDSKDIDEFAELVDTAYTLDEFDHILQITFSRTLRSCTRDGTSLEQFFNTGTKFLREGNFLELVKAVADKRPRRRDITEYYQRILARLGDRGRAPSPEEQSTTIEELPVESGVQKPVDPNKGDWDPMELAEWLPAAVRKVCLFGIQDQAVGTGFLVGCDLVITAYHNISPIVDEKKYRPEDVRLTFGYVYKKDRITLQERKTYSLQPGDWLVASSPSDPSEMDRRQRAREDPSPDHLDYALLRVADSPGNEMISGSRRGWFQIVAPVPLPVVKTHLYLLHHPAREPLKFSEGNDVIRLSQSGSRVDYKTNTRGGSSGAPCFDKDHRLIALHNYGQANSSASAQDGFNRGIPMATIVRDLQQKGCFQLINQDTPAAGAPVNMEQVLEQIRERSPGAYPFVSRLNQSMEQAPDRQENPSIRALISVFGNYNWTGHLPGYWLFMVFGLHIAVIGDPVMNKENLDRLIAQYEQYAKIGFDDPRLKKKIQKLASPQAGPIFQGDKINLEDRYGNRRASLFFRQLAEVLSIRWEFIEHLHRQWPELYVGSEIIGHSRDCLQEIENDIRHTLDLFRMYERLNEHGWPLEEAELYEEFASLSEKILGLLKGMGSEFQDLRRRLSNKSMNDLLPPIEHQYARLGYSISKYQNVVRDLANVSERLP
jgi:hypothetical protein